MSTFSIGDTVKILPPFDIGFTSSYAITDIVNSPDGTITYLLGELGEFEGFDGKYLEAI